MQGTQVQSLVQEDPTCHEARSLCTLATEPMHPIAQALQQEKPQQREAHTLQE